MTTTANALVCPVCGGECYDNRASKRNPKAPDARCKDRSCEGRIWKVKDPPARVTPADAPSVLEPRRGLQERSRGTNSPEEGAGQGRLAGCYLECVRFVLDKVRPEYERAGIPMDAAAVSAVTAQLFIARCQSRR